jgi:apolipoprotein N-acyltransferase
VERGASAISPVDRTSDLGVGPPGWSNARRLLAPGQFRRLVAGQTAGQAADGLAEITFAQVVIFEVGKGATLSTIAGVLAVTLLPFSLVGPFAGVVIDRFDRRRVLVSLSLLRVALALGAVAVVAARSTPLAYVGVLLLLSSSRFVLAAKGAALPRTVAIDDLVAANAVSAIAGSVAAFTGAVVGATFVAALPEAGFVGAAAMYAFAARRFSSLDPVGGGATRAALHAGLGRVGRELRDGIVAITHDRRIGVPLLAVWCHRFLLGAGFILLVLIGNLRYRLEAPGYGVALAVTGVGAFLGSWVAPLLARRFRTTALLPASFALAGVAAIVGGFSPNFAVLVAGVGVVAVAFQVLKVVVDALVGGATPDRVRGRVFATYDVVYNVAFVVAGIVLIPLWSPARERALLWLIGAAFVGGALVFARLERVWPFDAARSRQARPAPRHRWWWRGAALVCGAVPVFAFPLPSWWWGAWIALVPLLLVLRSAPSGREAAWRGWWGGTGFMVALHHWLLPSLGPFIVPLGMALGLLWLPWGALVHGTLRSPITGRRLVLAGVLVPSGWVVIEAIRSWQSLGGPWGLLGASQWNESATLATASLGGVWLVSSLIVAANTALAATLAGGTSPRVRAAAAFLVAGTVAVGPLWQALRAVPAPSTHVKVAVVQPGVIHGPGPRFDASERITRRLVGTPLDLVVWGESSVGFDLDRRPDLLTRIEQLSAELGAPVLVNVDARGARTGGIYKTAVLVGPHGMQGRYEKMRLVPFGEYIPLRPLFSWTTLATKSAKENRRRGHHLEVLRGDGFGIGPLVCFESAFPDLTRRLATRGADVIVVQSSDSTFQGSWEPAQHASLAAVRAVESGRPVVHATLTGISAVFDARGKELGHLGRNRHGALVSDVPLTRAETPYARLGEWVPALSFAALVLAGLGVGLARSRARKTPTGPTRPTTTRWEALTDRRGRQR